MLLPTLGSSSLSVVVAQPDERHANRTASVLSGLTDTEHCTTSGSNEVVVVVAVAVAVTSHNFNSQAAVINKLEISTNLGNFRSFVFVWFIINFFGQDGLFCLLQCIEERRKLSS